MHLFRTEEKRRQTLIKMNAPKSDDMWMDMYDGIKENPYKIEEVLETKARKRGGEIVQKYECYF